MLHLTQFHKKISLKSTKENTIRSSSIWKKSDLIPKSYGLQHVKTIFPKLPGQLMTMTGVINGVFMISGHIPDRHFPNQTHPGWTLPWPYTSLMDISLTRHIPDGHFPNQTHPRRTLPQPDTSPTDIPRPDTSPMGTSLISTSLTDTSLTRHIPNRYIPKQTNAPQIFAGVDLSHNGHFPDQLNTSNNLKYLKKYI